MPRVRIPVSSFKAAIFDMDGTMIKNMDFHKRAWREFLKRHGMQLSDEEFKEKVPGKKNDQIFESVFERRIEKDELGRLADEKEAIYREIYASEIKEVEGLTKIINEFHKHNLKTAIATTAPKKNRIFTLNSLKLSNKFEVILGDEHVTEGKPDPEIFLKTADKLGIEPNRCLVFEDSPPGVEAGKRAGMVVVGLLTSRESSELAGADYIINNFNDIQLA